jgi:hypothetical protein
MGRREPERPSAQHGAQATASVSGAVLSVKAIFRGPLVAQTSIGRLAQPCGVETILRLKYLQMMPFGRVRRRAPLCPTRPVTPEVAGSSPVAPVFEVPACRPAHRTRTAPARSPGSWRSSTRPGRCSAAGNGAARAQRTATRRSRSATGPTTGTEPPRGHDPARLPGRPPAREQALRPGGALRDGQQAREHPARLLRRGRRPPNARASRNSRGRERSRGRRRPARATPTAIPPAARRRDTPIREAASMAAGASTTPPRTHSKPVRGTRARGHGDLMGNSGATTHDIDKSPQEQDDWARKPERGWKRS